MNYCHFIQSLASTFEGCGTVRSTRGGSELREDIVSSLRLPQSQSLLPSPFLLQFLFHLPFTCLPPSSPLLSILSPLLVTRHSVGLPPSPLLPLLPVTTQSSCPLLVLLTLLPTLPCSPTSLFLLHGPHLPSSLHGITTHRVLSPPPRGQDLFPLHLITLSILLCLSPRFPLNMAVCVSHRSCTGDTKQLQSRRKPRPFRLSSK